MSAELFDQWQFLSLEMVSNQWKHLINVYKEEKSDLDLDSDWKFKWIPIGSNHSGDFLCLDLENKNSPEYGRVIEFYHTEDNIVVLAKSFKKYIKDFAHGLKNKEYIYIDEEYEERLMKIE